MRARPHAGSARDGVLSQQIMTEFVEVQQMAAKSTRSFAVILAKAKNNMLFVASPSSTRTT